MIETRTLHRAQDQPTSIAAAEAIAPKINDLQVEVLAYARKKPNGFTDYELARDFSDATSTIRSRRSELTRAGHILNSGERKQHGTGRREHIVWIHRSFAR